MSDIEFCEDCISRAEAISWIENLRTLNKYYHPKSKNNDLINCDTAIDQLKQVPRVQPEAKKEHWVIEGAVNCYLEAAKCHCSNCLSEHVFPATYNHITQKMYFSEDNKKWLFNYCPDCGAKMEMVKE